MELIVRKWHRWFSLFFGVFMLWMSVTGLIIHTTQLIGGGPGKAPQAAAKAGFVCPPDYTCRPRPKPGQMPFGQFIQHLHSGEALGPAGTVASIAAGVALLFFSLSGMWMYVQMWRARAKRHLAPRWLWK